MLLKHYLDQGVSKTELSRRFGVNRRTIHNWVTTGQLDRDLSAGARAYTPRPPAAHKLDPYKPIIDARLEEFPKLSAKRLFDEVRAAGYPGRLRAVERLRACDAPPRAGRAGDPVRDAGGPAGPGGLRDVHASLGPTPCPCGRAGLLPSAVAELLSATDDGGADGGAGERLRGVRRGSQRVAVRSDARRRAVRRSRRRGRPAAQRGVPALRQALGVRSPRLPTLPGEDEGQGRAPDPLHPGELLLRTQLRQRRRSQRAGRGLAGGHGQRAPAWHDGGAPYRPLRARRANGAASPWPTAPTAVSASGRLRSPRGATSR